MTINHIALYVEDLEGEKDFFETYFGGKAGDKYHNNKTGFTSYFLSFENVSFFQGISTISKPTVPRPTNFWSFSDNHTTSCFSSTVTANAEPLSESTFIKTSVVKLDMHIHSSIGVFSSNRVTFPIMRNPP